MSHEPSSPFSAPADVAALEQKLAWMLREELLETSPEFGLDSNLYHAGLDSIAIMRLLILIENEFGLMLEEGDLSRKNFTSIRRLARIIHERSQRAND